MIFRPPLTTPPTVLLLLPASAPWPRRDVLQAAARALRACDHRARLVVRHGVGMPSRLALRMLGPFGCSHVSLHNALVTFHCEYADHS